MEKWMQLLIRAADLMSDGLQIYDEQGKLIFANSVSEKLGGYELKKVLNRHLTEIYELDPKYSTVLSVLDNQKPVINRCDTFSLKRGRKLKTINCGYPIFEGNELAGVAVFESDITTINAVCDRNKAFESFLDAKESEEAGELFEFDQILGNSKEIRELVDFAKTIARTDFSVVIEGETGTGKELFAQSIHCYSNRKKHPFLAVNCAAVPESLFEVLFFGTSKGAYTGSENTPGYFEMATSGTLFLDEVNSLSLEKQNTLLRIIEEKQFRRIGESRLRNVDFRLICASNQSFKQLLTEQRLRKDFYFRISNFSLEIPPLRKRVEDIETLATFFLQEINRREKTDLLLGEEVLRAFKSYEWPGNVRELKCEVERFFLQRQLYGDQGDSCEVGKEKLFFTEETRLIHEDRCSSIREQLAEFERFVIENTLQRVGRNISRGAVVLGISRQNLQHRMRRLNIRL